MYNMLFKYSSNRKTMHLKFGYYDSDINSNVWVFTTPPSNYLTPPEFPTIHLSSDTIYPEIASNLTG